MARRYITLGYEVDEDGRETKIPVQVSREELSAGHVHIRGRTRSGKSSLSFLSLILQLIEPYEEEKHDPIVIVDLGGDQALFHATRAAAIAAGRRFRFVALSQDAGVDWDYFDAFEFFDAQGPMRQATALIEALNLDTGLVSDRVYFALQNVGAVLTALRAMREEGRKPSLDELAARLDMRAFKDAQQIWLSLQFLLEYPQLIPSEETDPDKIVSFRRALEDGELVYLYVPTMNEATTARAVAGLAVRNAIQAAIERSEWGKEPRITWIFVDEFQEITGRGFAATLAQCGKYGVSVLMANQTTDQLISRDTQLASVVRDNSHIKIYFSAVGDIDIRELQGYSGEDVEILEGGWSASLQNMTSIGSARKDFELSRDSILDTSSTFGHAFLIFDDGQGYRIPRRVWMSHRLSPEVYEVIRRKPLPRRRQLLALPAPAVSPQAFGSSPRAPEPPTEPTALARLIERKQAAERWDDDSIL